MTLLTPLYALPYPDALDSPCEFAAQWCGFADAVNAQLDVFQAVVDRTVPAIPLALLQRTTPLTIAKGDNITFDTVSVNTAAWVDFDADPTGITLTKGGRYGMSATAIFAPSGTTGANFSLTIFTDGTFTSDDDRGLPIGMSVRALVQNSFVRTYTLSASSTSALTTVTINAATFSVWWHSDRATP